MAEQIALLSPDRFGMCGNIWDMEGQADLAERFKSELVSGNRSTYVYSENGQYIAEVSLVRDTGDLDYTQEEKRIYLSRLIVKQSDRGRGIGRTLLRYAIDEAKKMGYAELSVGVDLDNYPALKLYTSEGFDKIVYLGEDREGKYVKLLKTVAAT